MLDLFLWFDELSNTFPKLLEGYVEEKRFTYKTTTGVILNKNKYKIYFYYDSKTLEIFLAGNVPYWCSESKHIFSEKSDTKIKCYQQIDQKSFEYIQTFISNYEKEFNQKETKALKLNAAHTEKINYILALKEKIASKYKIREPKITKIGNRIKIVIELDTPEQLNTFIS